MKILAFESIKIKKEKTCIYLDIIAKNMYNKKVENFGMGIGGNAYSRTKLDGDVQGNVLKRKQRIQQKSLAYQYAPVDLCGGRRMQRVCFRQDVSRRTENPDCV